MGDRTLDFIALGVLCFVVLTIIYGIIYIHDIPYEIAKKRNHPHQDAIHTAGWVSLFLMHTIWPFLWIWATLYKPGVGWGITTEPESANSTVKADETGEKIDRLEGKIAKLEEEAKAANALYRKHIKGLHQQLKQIKSQAVNGQEG